MVRPRIQCSARDRLPQARVVLRSMVASFGRF
jgi:hypothetical protein